MDDEVGILYLRCFINDISRYLSAIVCMTAAAAAAAAGNFFLPIPQQVSQSVSQSAGRQQRVCPKESLRPTVADMCRPTLKKNWNSKKIILNSKKKEEKIWNSKKNHMKFRNSQ